MAISAFSVVKISFPAFDISFSAIEISFSAIDISVSVTETSCLNLPNSYMPNCLTSYNRLNILSTGSSALSCLLNTVRLQHKGTRACLTTPVSPGPCGSLSVSRRSKTQLTSLGTVLEFTRANMCGRFHRHTNASATPGDTKHKVQQRTTINPSGTGLRNGQKKDFTQDQS